MAFISGTAGSVAYVNSGTTAITSAHEWSIDIGQKMPEVTAFGDSWEVFIPGIRNWKGSVSIRHDPAQVSQDFVRNMLIGGSAPVVFRFAKGANIYSGSAMPSTGKPGIAYDGAAVTAYDLQGSGPLAYA